MRDYIVSGVPLRDPAGYAYFMDYTRSELDGDVSRAISSGPDFGYHGAVPDVESYFGTSRETICLNLNCSDKDEFNSFLRGFQGLFSRRDFMVTTAPQRSALAAGSGRSSRSFGVSSSLLREARMRAVGGAAVERIDESSARVKWVLENIWGFYRSTVDYTTAPTVLSTATTALSLSSTTGDSTAPINSGTVRIKGPIALNGYVRIMDTNSTKGVGFRATSALASTDYVLIDMQTLKATRVGSDVWTGGVAVSSQVDLNGEGGFSIDPGGPSAGWPSSPFSYSCSILASGYTAGSTAVEVRLRRSYLS